MIFVTLLFGVILILSGTFLLSPGVFLIELGLLLFSLVGWRIVVGIIIYGIFEIDSSEQHSIE